MKLLITIKSTNMKEFLIKLLGWNFTPIEYNGSYLEQKGIKQNKLRKVGRAWTND